MSPEDAPGDRRRNLPHLASRARCFRDRGRGLDPHGGDYPLSHAVLGGRHLHDEYYVVHVRASEVRDIAAALPEVDREWLRHRFAAIDDPDYPGTCDDEDFDYTWTNFVDVQAFYKQAAHGGFAVLFTAT